nr:SRPBCC family protein [Gordonia insulae]
MSRRMLIADVSVTFDAAPATTFEYLVDPEKRSEWQSSLRRVEGLARVGERPGATGTAWTDVTLVPGVSPRMEVVADDPYTRWEEIGSWHFVDAHLTLRFDPQPADRTEVRAKAFLTLPLVLVPTVAVLRALAPRGLRADLRSAADRLAR